MGTSDRRWREAGCGSVIHMRSRRRAGTPGRPRPLPARCSDAWARQVIPHRSRLVLVATALVAGAVAAPVPTTGSIRGGANGWHIHLAC